MAAALSVFASSFLIAFSGAMMPGPLLSATIDKSAKHGFAAGPLFILGHGILELLLIALLFLGVAPLLTSPWFFVAVSTTGGLIMGWMGIGMIRGLKELSLSKKSPIPDYRSLVFTGAVLSLSNPYWTVWWATIGLGFILSASKLGYRGVAAFFIGHILADLTWYSAVSIAVTRGKKLLNDRAYRIIIGICALILIGFGCLFLIRGIAAYES
ncbi:MAG: LysE family transporter [Spirochaetales bacterium]|nr:LysE family transporter [Spirochaetales bacterium]